MKINSQVFEKIKVQIFVLTNGRDTIEETLQSIIRQTHKNWEVVVSDNSNSGDTRNICDSLNDSRIKYVGHKKNLGIIGSTAYCISRVDSQLFVLMHDDDYYHAKYLEEMIDGFNSNPDALWGFSNAILFNDQKTFSYAKQKKRLANYKNENSIVYRSGINSVIKILTGDITIIMPSVMFRNQVKLDIQLDPTLVSMGDLSLWLSLANKYDFIYINKPLFYYRMGEQNHTIECALTGVFFIDALTILERVKSMFIKNNMHNRFLMIEKMVINSHCKILLWMSLNFNSYELNENTEKKLSNLGYWRVDFVISILKHKPLRILAYYFLRTLKSLNDRRLNMKLKELPIE